LTSNFHARHRKSIEAPEAKKHFYKHAIPTYRVKTSTQALSTLMGALFDLQRLHAKPAKKHPRTRSPSSKQKSNILEAKSKHTLPIHAFQLTTRPLQPSRFSCLICIAKHPPKKHSRTRSPSSKQKSNILEAKSKNNTFRTQEACNGLAQTHGSPRACNLRRPIRFRENPPASARQKNKSTHEASVYNMTALHPPRAQRRLARMILGTWVLCLTQSNGKILAQT
jgi:hypothetical protein